MEQCNCNKAKNSNWLDQKVCRSCYKKLWAKSKNKTNTQIKYRKEFDAYVDTVKSMAENSNISEIEKATGLYHKAIVCIAKKHDIQFKRKGNSQKTEKREGLFLSLIKEGKTINEARLKVNFNAKKANALALMLGVVPKKKDELFKITKKIAQEKVKEYITVVGVSKKNNRRVFEVECNKCKGKTMKETYYLNTGCINCEKPTITQNIIHNWVVSSNLEASQNFKLPSRKELDIFIPSLNLAIEYCGLYWHSEKNGKDKNYHYNKMKEAKEQNVRLITIFEDEWLERQEQVKNFLLSVLNKNEHKVYGRNTYVKTIEKSAANRFYDENHIQGKPHATNLNVGLFSKNEDKLLGVMSFGPHHRGGDPYMSVLNRLAFLHNHTVYGGASKLFLFAADLLRKAGYKTIASWSDNRWSEGAVYEKLGFVLEEELKPDYSYVVGDKARVSKQSCQKKHLLKRGAVGKTELEMSLSLGYSRIWDCGKKRWVYSL